MLLEIYIFTMNNDNSNDQYDIEDIRLKVLEILTNLENKMITPETASRLAKELEKEITKTNES